MRVALIFISVIMMLRFALCSDSDDIEDLSDWCSNGREMYYYLTSGAGSSDKIVSMIATENHINCTVKFTVRSGNYIMLVLEFPDMKRHEKVCCTEQNNSITVSDYTENDECLKHAVKDPLRKLSKNKIAVNFRSGGRMSTVKIIATSLRDASQVKCSKKTETDCVFDEKVYCMTRLVLCDGHNNCGAYDAYDEDDRKCKGPSLSFVVILASVVMVLLTLFLLISIALCLVPPRKDPYVHDFDQSLSLFDCENGIVTVEIDIVILFPDKLDKPDKPDKSDKPEKKDQKQVK